MSKKISKALLCMLLIAVAVLFAASEVIAFCDNCDPELPLPISVTIGPYRITLNSINRFGATELYEWIYTVENDSNPGTLTGLNFLAMLIPECCNEPYVNFDFDNSLPDNLQDFPVAAGETTLNFGKYNQQAFVVKGTPNSTTDWKFVTTSNTPTLTTALIKYGKGKGVALSAEAPGPGCAKECEPPATRVEPRTQCWQFIAEEDTCEPASTWYVEWTEQGGVCAVKVWACDGFIDCGKVKSNADGTDPDCWELPKEALGDITTVVAGETQTLDSALTNNSQCDELWLRFVDDEGCNKRCYVSGGVKYCCGKNGCKPK